MIKRSRNGSQRPPIEAPVSTKVVRCAIYTRKSTEEGLQQDFNSLDAQREACEAYIASQRSDGWAALNERYDDGGYTGANTDRPAVQRLFADVQAGKIDVVIVYKIDRISRSLLDFARMMDLFERHQVSLVSVTQQFSTANSMGRLTLNILMSFAAFERDMISERTRDKLSAARKKGKWLGGTPVLGYTVETAPVRKLIPVPEEAAMVNEIFRLYLQHASLLEVAREINRRGWRTKVWVTKQGKTTGGRAFTKCDLAHLVGNVTYIGQVRFKGAVYEGEHEPIVDQALFEEVQRQIEANGRDNGAERRNRHAALLRGMISCGHCGKAMIHSFTTKGKKGRRLYRYYVCTTAQKEGYDKCPTKSVPAQEMEDFIVRQLRRIGQNPDLVKSALEALRVESSSKRESRDAEQRMLERQQQTLGEEARRLVMTLAQAETPSPATATRLAETEESIRRGGCRLSEIERERLAIRETEITEAHFTDALALFAPVWEMLSTSEQIQVLHHVVERVTYNGDTGKLEIRFSPTGINLLAAERRKEA